MHNLLGTSHKITDLLASALKKSESSTILDLCSGSGGPMPDVLEILRDKHDMPNISLVLTDLYPDSKTAEFYNSQDGNNINYLTKPFDVTHLDGQMDGLRTMIGSFHHLKPQEARKLLTTFHESGKPMCIFEVSDNSTPIWPCCIAFPINIIMTFFNSHGSAHDLAATCFYVSHSNYSNLFRMGWYRFKCKNLYPR